MSRDSTAHELDPFSSEAIALAQSSEHTWRRLFLESELRPIAKAKCQPSAGIETTNRNRVAIDAESASVAGHVQSCLDVQHEFRPATGDQSEAFESLKTLADGFVVGDFADAHECSLSAAARWLRFFLAKGVLTRGDAKRGHFFAKAKGE